MNVFSLFFHFNMIIIKFSDNIEHVYNSFEEILKLDNYNDIVYINCRSSSLTSLPRLPISLIYLNCDTNSLSSLPELPNSLTYINCTNNNLSSLPELPDSLQYIWYQYNNLSILPELPNSLIELCCSDNDLSNLPKLPKSLTCLWCDNNYGLSSLPELPNSLITLCCNCSNLSSLPELPNSLINIYYYDSPIYTYIEDYFEGDTQKYFEYYNNIKKKFSNKIGNWFLECKYNPKYLYCRKRLIKEYDELYNSSYS